MLRRRRDSVISCELFFTNFTSLARRPRQGATKPHATSTLKTEQKEDQHDDQARTNQTEGETDMQTEGQSLDSLGSLEIPHGWDLKTTWVLGDSAFARRPPAPQ